MRMLLYSGFLGCFFFFFFFFFFCFVFVFLLFFFLFLFFFFFCFFLSHLTLEVPSQNVAADSLAFYVIFFPKKSGLDISWELPAEQTIYMNNQALFSIFSENK